MKLTPLDQIPFVVDIVVLAPRSNPVMVHLLFGIKPKA